MAPALCSTSTLPTASNPPDVCTGMGAHRVLGGELAKPFFAFFLLGYLIYDYIHYSTHHFKTKSTWFKALKQHHMNHHFVNPELFFGVSSPLWDQFFGTKK